jgi:hypothetical protein
MEMARARQLYDEAERLGRDVDCRACQATTMREVESLTRQAALVSERFSEVANLASRTDPVLAAQAREQSLRWKYCRSDSPVTQAMVAVARHDDRQREQELMTNIFSMTLI